MIRFLIKIIPGTLILMMLSIMAFAQTDREFWFAAPDVDEVNSPLYGFYDRPIYLRITSLTIAANVTISIPANPSFVPINLIVPANSTSTIDLTPWIDQIENLQPNVVSSKGLYIQSTNDITVYYEVNSQTCKCNPELFALKGKNALGNDFYIPSQLTWSIDTVRHPNAKAAFDLVATEDNTSITITPSKPLIGRPANIPFTILLNKGETFSSQALYRKGSQLLNGSKISASKPISVTTKEDLLFGDGPCADLAGDQLVPINILGTEYGIVRGDLTTRDKVAISATQNNTAIYLDGNATPVATINAGQVYEADITTQPSLHIKSNKLVYVLHYTGSGCEVGSAIIPKLSCTGSKTVSIVRSNSGAGIVLIVAKNGIQNNFLVNGIPGVISASDFSPLTGSGGNYIFCKKDVTGSMNINTAATFSNPAGKFQLGFINGDPVGYMYGYFSDFKKSNVTTTQTEICKLDSAQLNAFGGITYQWSPSAGLSNPNINNPKASPSATTDYRVLITDETGCTDSAFVKVVVSKPNFDFNFERDACNPFVVQFNGVGNNLINPYWYFGDGNTNTGSFNPSNMYSGAGSYTVKYSAKSGSCTDTLTKIISLDLTEDNQLVLTPDTTICYGTSKKIRTSKALNFCWTPTTYLDDPTIPEPTTSTPSNITYHYTAEVTGNNIITNGDFSNGNTGFTSAYLYSPSSGFNPGVYNVGSNITSWHPGMSPCSDHTTGNGNMMMVNGADVPNIEVWSQTVSVVPNTNYSFSTWLQHITTVNPASLQFSINDVNIGQIFTASSTSCVWKQFYTTWNSGNNTVAKISIVNQNQIYTGNDFALDDISFAPVFIKKDSVKITVDTADVNTSADAVACEKIPVQLNTTGGVSYSWAPTTGLSNPTIGNPVATPSSTTEYIVTGINVNGCSAKDTVSVSINPAPDITLTNDTTICNNTSLQLNATGGNSYSWAPVTSLDNSNIPNPVASPATNTLYRVTVTNTANCSDIDSVQVNIKPPAVFTVNDDKITCLNDPVQLTASGGDTFTWQPQASLDDGTISNPKATPGITTTYSVIISESTCNESATLTTTITVLPLPVIKASKSNDIDCSINESQLSATGGASYSWSPGGTLNNPSISNPVATPVTSTQYSVTGTDISGCKNTDTVTIKATAINIGLYQLPTAFTPNADGLNDCYGLKYWGFVEELDFSIYNRWGERVFHTAKPSECWDGFYKGIKQKPGVFVYIIKAKTSCNPSIFRKGTFTLIR